MPICPACKGNFQLTKSGLIRNHGPRAHPCNGSGQKPEVRQTTNINNQNRQQPFYAPSTPANLAADQIFSKVSTIRWIPDALIPTAANVFADLLKNVT